jgi:uncharacterized protein involved in exopolysaccharide biosynthesis
MDLKDDIELANTRGKLAELETRYEKLRHEVSHNASAREATLRSLKRYINQFKEEIARYESRRASHGSDFWAAAPRGIQSDAQLENTRRKLNRLEELLATNCENSDDDAELRRAERISLKRLINQFKEEIARYEAHQPAR